MSASADNKIKYGIKNVYYAVATIAANGSATYDTPVALKGAVSLAMEPQGDSTPFYADNIVYYTSVANNGYEGDLELALIPDQFLTDILGMTKNADNVIYEDAGADPVHFALLFQFEGDQKATRHVLYNCTATRPSAAGNTKEDSIEPATESITITATTIYVPTLDKDIPKAKTTIDTGSATYDGWFTTVYVPAGTSATTT